MKERRVPIVGFSAASGRSFPPRVRFKRGQRLGRRRSARASKTYSDCPTSPNFMSRRMSPAGGDILKEMYVSGDCKPPPEKGIGD